MQGIEATMVRRYFSKDGWLYNMLYINRIPPSLSKWKYETFCHLDESSDKDSAIEINLNINLNGISNETNGVEILDEPDESYMMSRAVVGNAIVES